MILMKEAKYRSFLEKYIFFSNAGARKFDFLIYKKFLFFRLCKFPPNKTFL